MIMTSEKPLSETAIPKLQDGTKEETLSDLRKLAIS